MKKSKKSVGLFVSFVFLALGGGLWLLFNADPLIGYILLLLPPSLYLILRERKNLLKIFWAVVIFGGLFGFVFDFVETLNKAWTVDRILIPWRLFGFYPVDDILAFMLMTLFIVVFYEHFVDDERNRKISKNFILALVPSLLAIIGIVVSSLFFDSRSLQFSYTYLAGGIAAIIFPITVSIFQPRLIAKFLMIGAFFFIVWFITLIVALKTGGWHYSGEYIGKVEIFGVTFPFEELFFWTGLYASTIVSYYEFFIDDMR